MVEVKAKPSKSNITAPQKHIHSRISYLYQAATYLTQTLLNQHRVRTTIKQGPAVTNTGYPKEGVAEYSSPNQNANAVIADEKLVLAQEIASIPHPNTVGLPRRLLSHARSVSMKSQMRLTPTMKHSICKRCDILLVPSSTSTTRLENRSRGGKKPWADVLVVTCTVCGTAKRFPVGAKRQPKCSERSSRLQH